MSAPIDALHGAPPDASEEPPDLLAPASARTTTPSRTFGSILLFLAPAIGVLGFLGLWQALVAVFDVKEFILPTPWKILDHLASDPGFYFERAKITLWEAFLGFVLGAVVGIVVATAMAQSRFVERAVLPLVVLAQVTPLIAYAPAVVNWLDFGLRPVLFVTVLVCSVPFLINAVSGLRSVDPSLVELARSVDASGWQIYYRLRLPSSLPFLFSAARIAVGLALIGSVLTEYFAGTRRGLGYAVNIAQNRNLPMQLWGSVFVLAFLGSLAVLLITTIERFVLHWHASQRR